mgnify:CR=1 FL=1
MGMFQLISNGGITMYVLILCSILSIAIIIERILYYNKRSRVKREEFMADIKNQLGRDNTRHAISMCIGMCKDAATPFANLRSPFVKGAFDLLLLMLITPMTSSLTIKGTLINECV